MNPTKAQVKTALDFKFDTQLADFLGVHKQSLSRLADNDPLPDSWCWKGHKKRPDLFATVAPKPAKRVAHAA